MDKRHLVSGDVYFITSTVVDWVDIFTRPRYKQIIIDSLKYCQENKGLVIFAWVLMTNHLHMIVRSKSENTVADIVRDFKKFTSKKILSTLLADEHESRKEWMLNRFEYNGRNDKKIKNYRFWREDYHPELLYSLDFFRQKLNYVHMNPVRQEIVEHPEDYVYSSASCYAGDKGLLDVEVVRI